MYPNEETCEERKKPEGEGVTRREVEGGIKEGKRQSIRASER